MSWLDDINREITEINRCARITAVLSAAFYTTGNDKMADKLADIDSRLLTIEENIRAIVGAKLKEDAGFAYQSSINVFGATLAGIKLANNRED